ncbi:hypothetical protein JXL19_10820 [bacterium]|nr:hypothetical protein [bacterium]
MALKKSELYSSLWKSCDELRGGMDASQHKEQPDFTVGRQKFKSDLIPALLLITRYFSAEQTAIEAIETELAALDQQLDEFKKEQGTEGWGSKKVVEGEGDKRRITAKGINARLNEIGRDAEYADERQALENYAGLLDKQADVKKQLKAAQNTL